MPIKLYAKIQQRTNSFYIGHSCYEDFCALKSYLSKVISNRSNSDEFDDSNQKAYPNSRLEKKNSN